MIGDKGTSLVAALAEGPFVMAVVALRTASAQAASLCPSEPGVIGHCLCLVAVLPV